MPDGRSQREHFTRAAKQGVQAAVDVLREPPLRPSHRQLWRWWVSLNSRRPQSMHGSASPSWADADAWARRMNVEPTPREWDVLAAIDNVLASATAPPPEAESK